MSQGNVHSKSSGVSRDELDVIHERDVEDGDAAGALSRTRAFSSKSFSRDEHVGPLSRIMQPRFIRANNTGSTTGDAYVDHMSFDADHDLDLAFENPIHDGSLVALRQFKWFILTTFCLVVLFIYGSMHVSWVIFDVKRNETPHAHIIPLWHGEDLVSPTSELSDSDFVLFSSFIRKPEPIEPAR
jgi:hypothetical protein